MSPADTVITAPPRPTPPACTTPVMLPTPTVNSVLSVVLASPGPRSVEITSVPKPLLLMRTT